MPVAHTSLDAFIELEPMYLGRKQKAVLGFIRRYGPINNRELSVVTGWPINTITPRVQELRRMGFVFCHHEEIDPVTNRITLMWMAKM